MPAEVITSHVQKGHPNYSASVTVRAKAQTTGVGDDLKLNPRYFKEIPGIIKIIQLIIAIVCMCCISPPLTWYARLFTFVVAVSFALTLILCFCYIVSLKNVVFPTFDWLLAELVYTCVVSLLLLITSIIQLSITSRYDYRITLQKYGYFGQYIAAGVFGLLNFISYGVGAYFLFLSWKASKNSSIVHPSNGHA